MHRFTMVWRRGNILRKQNAVMKWKCVLQVTLWSDEQERKSPPLWENLKEQNPGKRQSSGSPEMWKHLGAHGESKLTDTRTYAGGSCSLFWQSQPGQASLHRRFSSGRSQCWESETPSGQPPAPSDSPGTSASIQPGSGVTGQEWPRQRCNTPVSAPLYDKNPKGLACLNSLLLWTVLCLW